MTFPTASSPSVLPILAAQAQSALGVRQAVWDKLVDKGGDFVSNLAISLLIVVVTFWAAKCAGRLVVAALGRFHARHDADLTLQLFAASVATNAIYIVGGIAVLQQLGVKTTSIIAAVGAASLAIGLAMQGALANVAAGVMILLFRPYRVGDIIESAGRTGRVVALDLFVTEMATLDNLKIVIPNGKVFADVIVNHSFHDRRRADVLFHVPPTADAPSLMARLKDHVAQDPRILPEPPALIEITGLTEAFIEIAARPWAARDDYGPVKADLLLCARRLQADSAAQPASEAQPAQAQRT